MSEFLGAAAASLLADTTVPYHPGWRMLLAVVHDRNIMRLYKGCLAMSPSPPRPCRFPRLKMLAIPAWLFLKHLRNGWIRQPKVRARAALPCLWGVPKPGEALEIAGVKRFTDDMYLYGEHFRPGEAVHIFGDWDIPEAGKREWREAMDMRGIPHADRTKFGVNGRLLRLTLRATWKIISRLFDVGLHGNYSPEIWRASIKGLYHYLLKHYEMENVEYRVEVVKNDYNPGHVAATIAANRAGRKRLGVSHVSSAVDSPQTCFVHFDRYATVCPMQVQWHGRHWGGLPLVRVGGLSIDSVVCENGRRKEIRERLEAKYGCRKHNALILFPGNAERCLVPQWEKMHQALNGFAKTNINATIFLRFRRLSEALRVPHMARIAALPERDSRFILEHEDFTTHELMAANDLVITANASFAINEALVIGKPVFTFDYTLKADLYFNEKGLILTEPEDVLRVIRALGDAHWPDDSPDWNRMRADADYHFDGKNRERLARAVAELAGT